MLLGLRISVNSYRGALTGVPRLVDILRRNRAGASFFFNLGPDRTGRAVLGPLRRQQTSTRFARLDEHGFKSLLYGTVLPGPAVGKRCGDILRATRDAGFDCALQGWDRCDWLAQAAEAERDWTEIEMRRGFERFADIFGSDAKGHAAAGWQMNRHALRMTQRMGFQWSSDCRGSHPFLPLWDGEPVRCPQLPTTLPTLDELGLPPAQTAELAAAVLSRSEDRPSQGHIFALSAELEGIALAECFESLLTGWREQGYAIVSLQSVFDSLNPALLPRHSVTPGHVSGRGAPVLVQGPEFLTDFKEAA